MSRASHPPTLLTLTTRALRTHALVERGTRVLVAVSGGPDSMALLHVLAVLRTKLGHVVFAHGVDHGLRESASSELDLAERFARTLDVPFSRSRVKLARGGNLQARARDARYAALGDAARKVTAHCIATAHHADDRAETFLLRLLRGAGPEGLAVLPPRAPLPVTLRRTRSASAKAQPPLHLIRPFLLARRTAILAHLARHEIPFVSDPSNQDPRFLRARVRHELLPLMAELSPGIVEHLCALADQIGSPEGPSSLVLPRATRDALARLAQSQSPKMRVLLPGGLVATVDRPQLKRRTTKRRT